ncbi:hypothetical protein ARMSODRAFT_974329 [Armillaria solidipes]|uniref:F-box domain-containing protein n=1 Tax=Armillaria solidipes TaxID=1076256 RepID=A0A2H3BWD8_9AGAR|nr:hypothetical protein ARMSODRAFT_974329 [Armillaria solidipes]
MAIKRRRTKRKGGHSDPAPNSLAGLPTEVLAIVARMLTTQRDIFSLARVSRRLNDVAMARWLGPPKEYLKRYSKFCDTTLLPIQLVLKIQSPDAKPQPFSSFAELRLCVVTKPRIPSMTLIFGRHYEKEYQEFYRYIDAIPGTQKPPAIHVELHIREMTYTPINVRAFNAFCTNLAVYDSVTSFTTTTIPDKLKGLDVKVPNSCQPVFHPPPFAALTTLRLDSISDHFFNWLLRSTAASPICELTLLHGFQNQHPIHIPTLRKLTLGGGSLTTSQLIRLLSDKAHSSISELTFFGEPFWEMPVKGRLIPLSANAMPSLKSLTAGSNILTNLLVSPKAFPKLERVEVSRLDGEDSSVAKDSAELLSRISCLPSVHCVAFPVGALVPTDWDVLSDSGIVLPNVTKFVDKGAPSRSPLSHPVMISQVRKVFPNVVHVDSQC